MNTSLHHMNSQRIHRVLARSLGYEYELWSAQEYLKTLYTGLQTIQAVGLRLLL